jgi:hypothetical protein
VSGWIAGLVLAASVIVGCDSQEHGPGGQAPDASLDADEGVDVPVSTDAAADGAVELGEPCERLDLSACPRVSGDRVVRTAEDLAALRGVCAIDGDLLLSDLPDASLAPLASLQAVRGDLAITGCDALHDLSGLDALRYVGGTLRVLDNAALRSVGGLERLETLRGGLAIQCDNLESLGALTALERVGGTLAITGSPRLASLEGLHALEHVKGHVLIRLAIGLRDVDGLRGLRSVGGDFALLNAETLTSVAGLLNLTDVGDDLLLGHLYALQTFDGLEHLRRVGERMIVCENTTLTDVSALEGVLHVGSDVWIFRNPALHDCQADAIIAHLEAFDGVTFLYENNADTCPIEATR